MLHSQCEIIVLTHSKRFFSVVLFSFSKLKLLKGVPNVGFVLQKTIKCGASICLVELFLEGWRARQWLW